MAHDEFPSRETLTAFFDRTLDDATRRRVVAHMTTCHRCYGTWVASTEQAARETSAAAPVRGSFGTRAALVIIAGVAAAILLALLPSRRGPDVGPSMTGVDALVVSARVLPYRTVAPRLSAAFEYRPPRKVTRGGAELADSGRWPIAGAAEEVRVRANAAPTPENLHALGLSYLLLGYFQNAVQTLERANVAWTDAAVLNDLAAAYYTEGVKKATARDVAFGLELSDAALAISPGSLPAQFNRALALEALENRPSALTAWQRYLELDPSSEWAAEARQHVSRLSVPAPSSGWESLKPRLERLSGADPKELTAIAETFPLRTRRTAENDLLPRWARAQARHDPEETAVVLAGLEVIGAALESRFADPTLADIARTISAATAAGNQQRLESLKRGYLAYAAARDGMGKDTTKARASFREAWKNLREAGSPSAYAAGMFAALQEYERRDYDEALHLLAAMKSERALTRYAPLAGQVLWMEGMVLLASGRPHESLQSYREAFGAFQRSGEIESAAAVDGLIAENLQALGDDDEAWTHRLRALPIVLDYGDARRQQVAFNEAAEAALLQDRLSAALEYQTSSVALAAGSTDEHMAAYSYLGRALILGRKGRSAAARNDIDRARAHAARVSDVAIRNSTTADVDMAEALVLQGESPAAAIPLLTRVLEYQQSGRYEFRTAQLLLARGRAHARLEDSDSARADFTAAIAAVESQRERVSDLRLRSAFFGRAEDAYEELTALLVRSGEFGEALAVFDRSCERTLTEVVRGSAMAGSIPSTGRTPTPGEGTALVEIAVLPDEIVAWTIRRSGTSVSRHSIPSSQVEEWVASYERAVVANTEGVETLGSKLYDVLIRPLGLDPASDRTITFVVDRALRAVPMATLYDRPRQRYLVEDFAIATAPSAGVYWHCSARVARRRQAAEVVAIGNARTGALALGLPDLPEAERELTEIAARAHGRLLLNERATPKALLSAAAGTSIVHFAGHALVNEQDRGRSALVLAPDGQDSSSALLYADQIARARLRAPLVVLSSCTTNSTTTRAAAGAVDVARAFLAAGVPTVLTSRWEVADDSARDLLTAFARELAAGSVSPAEALRKSQLEMLHRGNSAQRTVRSWCSFEIVGAN